MKLVIGVLCLGLLSIWNEQSVVSAKNIGARIIGGQEAKDKQFPFMAAINVETDNSTYFCGGALITNEWILTSGQCLSGAVVLTVSLGSIALEGEDPNRVIITTSEFTIHPDFDPTTFVNDIALLKLQVSVSSDYIKPIKLAEINLPVILTPTALGWGQTKDDNNDLAPILNYVDVGVLTNEQCQLTYGSQIVDSMVCVGGSTNEGSCYGDSGSPLVVRPLGASSLQHVGVSSFFSGNGCETTDPSGYTRTYPYIDWIKSVTGL